MFVRSRPLLAVGGALLLLMAIIYFSNPLNRFAASLLFEDIMGVSWQNGLCTRVDMPATASPEDILNKAYGSRPFQIIEAKKFWMPNNTCWAARCRQGGRIATLLFYFQSGPNGLPPYNTIGWWTIKFYY